MRFMIEFFGFHRSLFAFPDIGGITDDQIVSVPGGGLGV